MKTIMLIISILSIAQAKAKQSNFHFSHTDSTYASSEKIWLVWTDVAHWKQWDKGLKEAFLDGEFKLGAKGLLIPDQGPQSHFIINAYEPNKSYTFKTKIPFGWLIIKRSLEVKGALTYFTHDVEFTGILKKLLGRKLGKKYRAMLPHVMSEIKQIAETK